jgi:hypothetical protein
MEPTRDLLIAAVAAHQNGVFSATQAGAVGFTRDAMHRRVRAGRWGRMHRGVFRMAGSPPTPEQAVMAAWLAIGSDAVISHATAGRFLGLPLHPRAIELTVAAPGRHRVRGLVVHSTTAWLPADRATIEPFVTTSMTRTIIDLAAVLSRAKLVHCIDVAVTSRKTSVPYLRRRLVPLMGRGRPHIADLDALLVARYPNERAPESVLERGLVDLLDELPGDPIVPQFWVQLPNGDRVRLDGAWPLEMLAVEGDSYLHHSSPEAWALDQTKRVVLTAMGWRILPFTHFDVTTRPRWVLEQVAMARKLRLAS